MATEFFIEVYGLSGAETVGPFSTAVEAIEIARCRVATDMDVYDATIMRAVASFDERLFFACVEQSDDDPHDISVTMSVDDALALIRGLPL